MFNMVPILPIASAQAILPQTGYNTVVYTPVQQFCNDGTINFSQANNQINDSYLMYQKMLFDIIYSTNLYTGWNNIPLYDIPPMDFNLSQNYQTNPFNINTNLKFDFDYPTNFKTDNGTKDRKTDFSQSLVGAGYDITKGQKLAKIAKKNMVGWTGYCARHVKTDIKEAGLGKYESGHAYQCTGILDRNPNFKRVNISIQDLKKTPGIVLVYGRGVSRYSKDYGHIEITGGDGCAYSDGRTKNIRPGYVAYAPVSSKSYKA